MSYLFIYSLEDAFSPPRPCSITTVSPTVTRGLSRTELKYFLLETLIQERSWHSATQILHYLLQSDKISSKLQNSSSATVVNVSKMNKLQYEQRSNFEFIHCQFQHTNRWDFTFTFQEQYHLNSAYNIFNFI